MVIGGFDNVGFWTMTVVWVRYNIACGSLLLITDKFLRLVNLVLLY